MSCSSSEKDSAKNEQVYHREGYNFRSAEECRECHEDIVEEWSRTSHATTALNPVYTRITEKFYRDNGLEPSTICTGCHMPGGPMIGEPPHLLYEQRNPIAQEGVTCDACHTATMASSWDVGEFEGIRMTFAKSDVVFGTGEEGFIDGHDVQNNDLISEAQLCLGCHSPHLSYLGSQAEEAGITCQDCHMTTTPGAPFGGELSHQIVGLGYAYDIAVEDAPNKEELLAKKQEWLERSLRLETADLRFQGGEAILLIQIQNIFNAHWIPSVGGGNSLRQIWLEVEVWDQDGNLIFESGYKDEYDDLCDEFSSEVRRGSIEQDEQLWNLQTTSFVHVQDYAIPTLLFINNTGMHEEQSIRSGELRDVQYSLPSIDPLEPIFVEISINQRHYAPYMLREIDMIEFSENVPVITIDSWEGEL